MGENTKGNTKIKGGASGKGFDVLGQPSPEAKSKGWEKRRARLEIMDKMTELRNLSMKEIDDLMKDIKNNPQNHTVLEAKLVQYMNKEKFMIDFLDRNVGKASQEVELNVGASDEFTDTLKKLKGILDEAPKDRPSTDTDK